MSWKTNKYIRIHGFEAIKSRIFITGRISSNTNFSLVSSGVNYNISGDAIPLGDNITDFLLDNNIRILLNGVELDKSIDIIYVDTNTFKLNYGVDKDDIILIYG